MKKYHKISNVKILKDRMSFVVDGRMYEVSLKSVSQRIAAASLEAQNTFQISPSGYGIRWQLIDEDLSVDGLIKSSRSVFKRKRIPAE